ncbi:UNVERIFIED_CONTAM: hypothetical protein FKN15_059617 [Acipenser sinensis]
MAGVFIVFTALLLCLPDLKGIKIDQSPPSLCESPERSAELQCYHGDSSYPYMYWYQQTSPSQGIGVSQTPQVLLQGAGGSAGMFCEHDGDSSYTQMYWYRQLRGQGIQLLVFSEFYKDPEFEKDFSKDRYEVKRSAETKGSLKIKKVEPDPSEGISIEQSPPVGERPGQSAVLECHHDDSNYDYMYWHVKMAGVFIVFTALLLCLPDFSDGINIVQSPPLMIESPGPSAELNCSHDASSNQYMYWYQQTKKGALELIGYLNNEAVNPEGKFKERFILTGDARKAGPSEGIGVSQNPQVILQGAGGSAGMFCQHDGGIDYKQMYWYRQLRGQGIQLLVFSMFGSDPQFEKDFNEERPAVLLLSLQHRHVKMAGVFIVFTALLLCLPDFSAGIKIVQSPPSLFESPGPSAELQCYHDPSEGISIEQSPPVGERPGESAELECHHDDSSYNYMYWYQQSRGEGSFKLIGYLQYSAPSPEEKFKKRFNPSEGISIEQSPPVGERPGQSAELECHHDDSSYSYMYWYQKSRGEGAFKLIGYAYKTQAANYEDDFKTRFNFTKQATERGTLTISNLAKEDSAIYYCAASKAQCCRSPVSSTKTLPTHSLASVYLRTRHLTTWLFQSNL